MMNYTRMEHAIMARRLFRDVPALTEYTPCGYQKCPVVPEIRTSRLESRYFRDVSDELTISLKEIMVNRRGRRALRKWSRIFESIYGSYKLA